MNIRITTEENILDCVSASELCDALKHLKALTRQEKEERADHDLIDISFSREGTGLSVSKAKKPNPEPTLSFQLYQSKRLEEAKLQKTARRKVVSTIPEISEVKLNMKSKEIIKERQLKGQKWLPIHLRTQRDLQKKKDNIERIKSQLGRREDDSIRQCTFKPKLNPFSAGVASRVKNPTVQTINNVHANHSTSCKNKENVTVTSREIEEVFIEKKFTRSITSTERTIPRSRIRTQHPQVTPVTVTTPSQEKSRPKNKSFNILLDLIQ